MEKEIQHCLVNPDSHHAYFFAKQQWSAWIGNWCLQAILKKETSLPQVSGRWFDLRIEALRRFPRSPDESIGPESKRIEKSGHHLYGACSKVEAWKTLLLILGRTDCFGSMPIRRIAHSPEIMLSFNWHNGEDPLQSGLLRDDLPWILAGRRTSRCSRRYGKIWMAAPLILKSDANDQNKEVISMDRKKESSCLLTEVRIGCHPWKLGLWLKSKKGDATAVAILAAIREKVEHLWILMKKRSSRYFESQDS